MLHSSAPPTAAVSGVLRQTPQGFIFPSSGIRVMQWSGSMMDPLLYLCQSVPSVARFKIKPNQIISEHNIKNHGFSSETQLTLP